jgi:hypothetical protein
MIAGYEQLMRCCDVLVKKILFFARSTKEKGFCMQTLLAWMDLTFKFALTASGIYSLSSS